MLSSTWRWRRHPTPPSIQGTTTGEVLSLLLSFDHDRPRSIVSQLQMRATGETVAVRRRRAKYAEADAADEADVDDVTVAEAGGTEVDRDTGGQDEM